MSHERDLNSLLKEETKSRSLLEQRFECLASNHEEMIKIKDEYKSQNKILLQENEKLQSGSREKLLQSQETQLQSLKLALREEGGRLEVMETKCVSLEEKVGELENKRVEKESEHRKEIEKHKQIQEGLWDKHVWSLFNLLFAYFHSLLPILAYIGVYTCMFVLMAPLHVLNVATVGAQKSLNTVL